MISKNFIKASLIYTVAGALPIASAVILLPFYILYLPTDIYGALSLYLAFSILIQTLVTYSFDSSAYIHYHDFKGDSVKLSQFISSIFIFMILIGVVVGLLSILAGELIFRAISDNSKISFYPYGIMSVLIGISQALNRVYNSVLQSSEKQTLYLWSNLLYFLLVASLTVIGLYFFPKTLIGPIGGRMIAGMIILAWTIHRVARQFGFKFNYPLLKSTFGFNHFTFLYQVEQWMISYFDRFLLIFFLPLSTIGVFDFANKSLIAIEFITNGLHSSFYPKVVSTISAQTTKGSSLELNRYYYGLVGIVMITVSLAILGLPIALSFFKNKNGYDEALPYFPYLAVIFLLRSVRYYFAIPYGVLKNTKPLPAISLATSIVKFALLLLLVKQYELYGVIIASLISSIIEIWLLKHILGEKFNFKFNSFKLIIAPALLLCMVFLIEPLTPADFKLAIHFLYLCATVAALSWIYRNELKLFKTYKLLN